MNPAGWVAVLVTSSGVVNHETAAINLYLIETHALTLLAPAVGDALKGRFLSCLFTLPVSWNLPLNDTGTPIVMREKQTARW